MEVIKTDISKWIDVIYGWVKRHWFDGVLILGVLFPCYLGIQALVLLNASSPNPPIMQVVVSKNSGLPAFQMIGPSDVTLKETVPEPGAFKEPNEVIGLYALQSIPKDAILRASQLGGTPFEELDVNWDNLMKDRWILSLPARFGTVSEMMFPGDCVSLVFSSHDGCCAVTIQPRVINDVIVWAIDRRDDAAAIVVAVKEVDRSEVNSHLGISDVFVWQPVPSIASLLCSPLPVSASSPPPSSAPELTVSPPPIPTPESSITPLPSPTPESTSGLLPSSTPKPSIAPLLSPIAELTSTPLSSPTPVSSSTVSPSPLAILFGSSSPTLTSPSPSNVVPPSSSVSYSSPNTLPVTGEDKELKFLRRKIMNWSTWIGYVLFFLVPILLWSFGTVVIRRKGFPARAFAFVAGSDNRLSLSRLQAFLWTLVIFGSFAAAMAVHTQIISGTKAEIDKAVADAKTAADKAAALKADADKAVVEAETEAEAKIAADKAAVEAEAYANALAADTNATPEAKAAAQAKATQARADAQGKAALKAEADKIAIEAKAAADKADTEAEGAATKVKSYNWVEIPAELLALAGIAIGSGVFSSLISAVNSEEETASVISIESISKTDLKTSTSYPNAVTPANPNSLVIKGYGMGKSGKVRLGKSGFRKEFAPILYWKDDGKAIVMDVPDQGEYTTLVVDTPNGKLCYELSGKMPNLTLGLPKYYYEFVDLFRDDKNPSNFDLMKFQMFGWTVIAIAIYIYLFLADVREDIESLPLVPQSIVILTGLSQAGYLTGKAVSNVGPNEKK